MISEIATVMIVFSLVGLAVLLLSVVALAVLAALAVTVVPQRVARRRRVHGRDATGGRGGDTAGSMARNPVRNATGSAVEGGGGNAAATGGAPRERFLQTPSVRTQPSRTLSPRARPSAVRPPLRPPPPGA
ncbi:hypothetical protein [Streptosporangium sp. NPDC051022]|uniref:hypothetical protein n=1 Tax=Streptosporangium sp. NPDC051022 TaxID=3155752 RepID=UPI003421E289